MAASCHSSFLNASLATGAADQPPRLYSFASALEMDPNLVHSAVTGHRVVPLLLWDVEHSIAAFQRCHMDLFRDNLDDFLKYDDTSDEECSMLLVLLLSFMQRRGGLTPLQTKYNNCISDTCYHIWMQIFANSTQPKFPIFLRALRALLERCGLTKESFFARVGNAAPPNPSFLEVSDLGDVMLPDQRRGGEAQRSSERSNAVFEHHKLKFPLSIHPFYFTLDCVRSSLITDVHCFYLSEVEYLQVESWFSEAIFNVAPNHDSATWIDSKFAIGSFLKSHRVVGSLYLGDDSMDSLRQQFPNEECSLFDFVKFLYPETPAQFLLRRIHGVSLIDLATEKLPVGIPSSDAFKPSSKDILEQQLNILQRTGQATGDVVALLLRQWLSCIDPLKGGKLTKAHLLQPTCAVMESISNTNGGPTPARHAPITKPMSSLTIQPVRLGEWQIDVPLLIQRNSGVDWITVRGLLQQFFPTLRKSDLDAISNKAEETFRVWFKHVQDSTAEANKRFESEMKLFLSTGPPPLTTTAPSSSPKPNTPQQVVRNPAGNSDVAVVERSAFLSLNHELRVLFLERRHELLHEAEVAHQLLLRRREMESVVARQKKYIAAISLKQLPEFGPSTPLSTIDLFGFRVNEASFHMDFFLSHDEEHPMMIQFLTVMDHSGILPHFFLQDRSTLHTLIPRLLSSPCKVFRDFAFCTRRPNAFRPWVPPLCMHIKFNLLKRSDTKYRIHLEGYNFGVNAPIDSIVCGYASRVFERVDVLESYGWPEGWDKHTIHHKAKGISRIRQYITSDGFVAFQCEAASFCNVGFSVSAWLVTHDYGTDGILISASFHHQCDPL